MYYYGNNSYNSYGCNPAPYAGYCPTSYGHSGCIWIVLFILLVIIVGAGWINNPVV